MPTGSRTEWTREREMAVSEDIMAAKGDEIDSQLLLLDARYAKQKAWDNLERATEAYRAALWKVFDDYENETERAAEDAAYENLVAAIERVRAARQKELEGYRKHSEAIAKLRAAVE